MNTLSAFLIGGTASGSGKTTLTLGIMAALKARGLQVQPFKCGPDFIDPSLHKMVTGLVSSNLDLRMCGKSFCTDLFSDRVAGKDVAVVEGVMGLFDGGDASSASLASVLHLPVVLVVDARSAGESVAAVVKGFEEYSPEVDICGVIFNRVGSSRHLELIEQAAQSHCKSRILGYFPRDLSFEIPDRHLGLHMGEENPLNSGQLTALIEKVEQHIDLAQLLQLSKRPLASLPKSKSPVGKVAPRVRLAVARDRAFCFYYQDNLRLLEEAGAELVFFSPLTDRALPAGCHGVYFGGGYPELHAGPLSANHEMLASVHQFGLSGGIIYAECGGFMYLCEQLSTIEHASYAMCAIFPFQVRMKTRFSRLGYRRPRLEKDCFLGKKGEWLHGHEFHYSELVEILEDVDTLYEFEDGRREGYQHLNVIAGYIHLHFGRSGTNVTNFIHYLSEASVISR
ncbi:MAG: cobyrinate a,c-diamide synthase [Proteobacteria bacterium]|nr:cobyrinate a,c-diamide synthase [Pseudomonadota bacterium]MBU1059508.1 cobyrinate a,c-diamide synthase [Pseudomonadota bacterium]